MFDEELREQLPVEVIEAMRSAVVVVTDHALIEYGEMVANDLDVLGYGFTTMFLPPRYRLRYDQSFVKDYIVTLAVVGWKIAQQDRIPLSSTAEYLALNAFIEQADVILEDTEGAWETTGAGWKGWIEDLLLEDTDFKTLWLNELDGIDEDPDRVGYPGMESLKFDDWFVPYNRDYGEANPYNVEGRALHRWEPDEDELDE